MAGTLTIPSAMLPGGSAEGDVLKVLASTGGDGRSIVTITLDPAEKAARLERSAAQVARGGKGGEGEYRAVDGGGTEHTSSPPPARMTKVGARMTKVGARMTKVGSEDDEVGRRG